MDEKLKQIYKDMLTESESAGANQNIEDSGKMKPKNEPDENVEVPTPVEGKSQEEVSKGGAKKREDTVVSDSFNYKSSSNFENLYKSVIGEEEDIVPAGDVEGDEFNDELGDFEGDLEGDIEEETSIAVELRTMAERLQELADKYAGSEDEEDFDGLEDEDMGMDEDEDEEDVFEAVKSEPEPKPHNPSTNRSKTAKGRLSSVSKKKAKTGIKGTHTGEPNELNVKGGHTNTKGHTAKASGPSASKKSTDAFC
jgi:hypothetical protein